MVICSAVKEKDRTGLSYSKICWGRGSFAHFHRLLYRLGKSSGQNGISHPFWVKIWDETITVKSINAPNKNSKFFLLQSFPLCRHQTCIRVIIHYTDWLVLTVYQPVSSYLMPRGERMTFVVLLDLHVLYYCLWFFWRLYQVYPLYTNNLHTILWFKVFLSNTNSYIVSSYYFYLIILGK